MNGWENGHKRGTGHDPEARSGAGPGFLPKMYISLTIPGKGSTYASSTLCLPIWPLHPILHAC